jgi:hypothetical protein
VPEITQTKKTKHGVMTVEEMKSLWPDEDWVPPKTMSEKELPKEHVPEKKVLRRVDKCRTAEEKMFTEQKPYNPDFRTTVLERRLIAKRISMEEFQKQHYLGKKAVVRPDTKNLFELGQYVIVTHMKGYPQFDGAGALVTNYEEAANGTGSYTIALLGRHAGSDFVGCPANILTSCTDEKVWNKMLKVDAELARDCVFIEFGSELKDHIS